MTNSFLGRASFRLFKIEHYCISPVIDSAPKDLGAKSRAEKLGQADEVGGVQVCAWRASTKRPLRDFPGGPVLRIRLAMQGN